MLKINLLDKQTERKARRMTVLVALGFTLFVGLFATLGADASYRAATRGTDVLSEVGQMFTFSDLQQFVMGGTTADGAAAIATPDNKLNVLLLGIGGDGHDGPQLTDTIIYASFDETTNKLGLVSIPRDLGYPLGQGRYEKINAVNAYNEEDHPGQGAELTAQDFSKLFNVRIDRVVKIDFKGFTDLVDALGGIDINVPNSFVDRSFPTDDDGPDPFHYQTVSFTKGAEHMDGARALEFVRSRHGTNGEDSDFARSRRQELVLSAVRERLLSLGTLSNPKTMSDIWTAISSHIQTNLTAWDLVKLAPLAVHFSPQNLTTTVMTDGNNGQLVSGNIEGAFMLFPKNSDWAPLRALLADPFESAADLAKQDQPQVPVTIEIKNGTLRTGFAAEIATKLKSDGYTIAATGNATERTNQKTVIYDLTNGALPDELARLKRILSANVSSSDPTNLTVLADDGSTEKLTTSATQFLIILGDSSVGMLTNTTDYASQTNP
ncbi:MAG: LCP family protein [Patescibacteria group bacterium]